MKIEGEMDMSKAMFVITHKSIEKKIELDDFYYLGVGNNKNNAEFKDSSMDNISEKNPHYCELTGLYWMWKNTNYEEIGLCHYRRFFCKIKQGMYKLCTVDELSCYLENVDIILPKKVININIDGNLKVGNRVSKHQYLYVITFDTENINKMCNVIEQINNTVKIFDQQNNDIVIRYTDFNSLNAGE